MLFEVDLIQVVCGGAIVERVPVIGMVKSVSMRVNPERFLFEVDFGWFNCMALLCGFRKVFGFDRVLDDSFIGFVPSIL